MEICALKDRCGGCFYQGVPYEEQLAKKEAFVRKCLAGAGLDPALLTQIRPSPSTAHYRNKMEYSFGAVGPDGTLALGLHERGRFLSVVDTPACLLAPEDFHILRAAILSHCQSRGYAPYNKKTHRGLLRSLVLRRGVRTGELLVNLVTTSSDEGQALDEEAFCAALDDLPTEGKIVGVLHTINDNPADAIVCDTLRVLCGNAYYRESVLGLDFQVGAFSFFQTHVDAAERLYYDALALVPDLAGKTVYDLYCGSGTLTQAMALKAKRAIGVEISEDAVQSARVNAEKNGLRNCVFLQGDVGEVLSTLSEKPDAILVDPPRSGIAVKALREILSCGAGEIVYISCNPKTLAENLRGAVLYGYRPQGITAYDNFPYTQSVECLTRLARA